MEERMNEIISRLSAYTGDKFFDMTMRSIDSIVSDPQLTSAEKEGLGFTLCDYIQKFISERKAEEFLSSYLQALSLSLSLTWQDKRMLAALYRNLAYLQMNLGNLKASEAALRSVYFAKESWKQSHKDPQAIQIYGEAALCALIAASINTPATMKAVREGLGFLNYCEELTVKMNDMDLIRLTSSVQAYTGGLMFSTSLPEVLVESALQNFRALEKHDINCDQDIVQALNTQGLINNSIHDYQKAWECFEQAYSLFEKNNLQELYPDQQEDLLENLLKAAVNLEDEAKANDIRQKLAELRSKKRKLG